ncbi:MAG: phospho-N-acetylmuramoyl-pentapeptide-transferase [Candidatus Eremiobacteraeota bacterium]|nr:phospho-N-acetylmuramoyl-pentapeptide-transferase [Candidatus Eremiobacteraeota bacterium]MBC5820467.1 phospho-N-acetylmuramoyl-pentapeptide-transferase [Candidatus Eremiobacteraeota bacterium]
MREGIALGVLFVAVLGLTLAAGPRWIALLGGLAIRQHAYEDAPTSHAKKSGTPTMGGALFCIGLLASLMAMLLIRSWSMGGLGLVLLGLACGAVGALDDWRSIRMGRNRGLRARDKFALTALAGIGFLTFVTGWLPAPTREAVFTLGSQVLRVPQPLWYLLALLALLATTHAVNLTDGLDGLAAGSILPPLAVFAWLGWQNGAFGVCLVDIALAASTIGFLAFNRHPARVFMGDTGALLLGGVLAGSAVLTGTLLLLPVVGGVFAAEALSVIAQVGYFKTTRRRIFRMSPLHHHFELGGWPETKVTARFWTASALCSLAGVVIAR